MSSLLGVATGLQRSSKRSRMFFRKANGEIAYHQCHTLRALLGDLKMTGLSLEHVQMIDKAVNSLTGIENNLDAAIRKRRDPRGMDRFNASLSSIQVTLEEILTEATSGRGG